MDQFRLEPIGQAADQRYQQLAILVNGTPLLDLVRAVEVPLVAAEHLERTGAGEPDEEVRLLAGNYMYPTIEVIRENRGRFFGAIESMFRLASSDPARGKTCVLGCDCGEPSCWPLLVRISSEGRNVHWSDFCQFHRDWVYPLGPFNFDADDYARELSRYREG